MQLDRSADNVEQFKVAKKTAKRVVSEARGRMYDGLYQWLDMESRRTSIRWAKAKRGRQGTSSKLNALRIR
jgi:hypothetical protein